MAIHLIAAMTKNRIIGNEGQLAWHLPKDLQHFKRLTLNKPIIMGRKTYTSIGKALPGRRNIVLTRDQHWHAPAIETAHSIDTVQAMCADDHDIMVIGGGEIYRLFLPYADSIYLTIIHANIPGDTLFPPLQEQEWIISELEQIAPDAYHAYPFAFYHYQRR